MIYNPVPIIVSLYAMFPNNPFYISSSASIAIKSPFSILISLFGTDLFAFSIIWKSHSLLTTFLVSTAAFTLIIDWKSILFLNFNPHSANVDNMVSA